MAMAFAYNYKKNAAVKRTEDLENMDFNSSIETKYSFCKSLAKEDKIFHGVDITKVNTSVFHRSIGYHKELVMDVNKVFKNLYYALPIYYRSENLGNWFDVLGARGLGDLHIFLDVINFTPDIMSSAIVLKEIEDVAHVCGTNLVIRAMSKETVDKLAVEGGWEKSNGGYVFTQSDNDNFENGLGFVRGFSKDDLIELLIFSNIYSVNRIVPTPYLDEEKDPCIVLRP